MPLWQSYYDNFSTEFIKKEGIKKKVLENSVHLAFLFSFFSIQMRVLIVWVLENSRLTKYEEKSMAEEKKWKIW